MRWPGLVITVSSEGGRRGRSNHNLLHNPQQHSCHSTGQILPPDCPSKGTGAGYSKTDLMVHIPAKEGVDRKEALVAADLGMRGPVPSEFSYHC